MPDRTERATPSITTSVTCLGCGCACDDIEVVVEAARIVESRNACALGISWFGDGVVPARVRVDAHEVSMGAALDVAARLLGEATTPLVYLAPDLSCEAQGQGVGVADALRACLDGVTSATVMEAVLATQERGRASATLGEVRHRADVMVFWGVDPSVRYPRYWTRYAPDPVGMHAPLGRRSRTVVAVDVGHRRGPSDADLRVSVPAEMEVATLTALGALVRTRGKASTTGTPWALASDLAGPLLSARYAVVVVDGEPEEGSGRPASESARTAALIALTQALNAPTRCALSTLRAGGNRSGAESVATSQAGYPAAIDFARGYPRYRPHDGSAAARLSRGSVDAVLLLGSAHAIPSSVLTRLTSLARVPIVVIGPRASGSPFASGAVVIDTGVAGIHEAGTALRMDDVPLPLRPSMSGPPQAVAVLQALRERILRLERHH